MGVAEAALARLQRSWWRPSPDALAHALRPLALLYGALLRRRLAVPPVPVGVPVVVVGNLIVGGAGKTPTVLAVVDLLRQAGRRPGVVSRGHGRHSHQVLEVGPQTPARDCGDEPLLIHLRSGAPVVVGRDRVAAARSLLQRHPEVDVIVSDDGLQHRALARDVEVVVFDERGAGNGLLLPAGPLREPLPPALAPKALVLYNAALPTTALPGPCARRVLAGVVPLAQWWQGAAPQPLAALHGRPLLAAAGIAAPQRFFAALREAGLHCAERPLPDHHDFADVPWRDWPHEVVVTEKDAVKLSPQRADAARVWVAALDLQLPSEFGAALLRALPPPKADR